MIAIETEPATDLSALDQIYLLVNALGPAFTKDLMVCMYVCMYVCHIFMQEDNICMYSVLLCKQLCVCMYDTLYVYVCMYVCMRSVQGAGGTSFLNRTEAAAVEKLVTLMLKAGSIFMSIHT